MNRTTVAKALAITLAPALFITTGCAHSGATVDLIDTVTENNQVDLGSVESVDVYVDMNIGTLEVSGGAEGLMDATFTYNVAEWKPVVKYDESDGKGALHITQPDLESKNVPDGAECTWHIALTRSVPLNIYLDSGVGKATMNLDGVQVSRLELDQGVGSLGVYLGQSLSRDADIEIEGGIGELKLDVPEGVGIRLEADLGIGSLNAPGMFERDGAYVNDAYGKAERNVTVKIDAGIGSITISTGGATAVV